MSSSPPPQKASHMQLEHFWYVQPPAHCPRMSTDKENPLDLLGSACSAGVAPSASAGNGQKMHCGGGNIAVLLVSEKGSVSSLFCVRSKEHPRPSAKAGLEVLPLGLQAIPSQQGSHCCIFLPLASSKDS